MFQLHKHFEQIKSEVKVNEPEPQSLVEMGGSKKRKREDYTENEHQPTFEQPSNEYHTPVPNIKKGGKQNKRKRSYVEKAGEPNCKHPKNEDSTEPKNQLTARQRKALWFQQRKRNLNSGGPSQSRHQEGNQFKPYDYSSVDFNQFQGGAGSVRQQQNIKSNFKSKVQVYCIFKIILNVNFAF